MLFLSACGENSIESPSIGTNGGGIPSESPSNETRDEYETMNEPLLTKEEFLRLASENENLLGVIVSEFEDIDLDDMIQYLKMSKSMFRSFTTGGLIFEAIFESYVSGIERRKIQAHRATVRREVDSTDEEYEEFKNRFFEKIGGTTQIPSDYRVFARRHDFTEEFFFQEGDRTLSFLIGRTMYFERLETLEGWEFPESNFQVFMPVDSAEFGATVYISKNGKYFTVFYKGIYSEETIKAFVEIDD